MLRPRLLQAYRFIRLAAVVLACSIPQAVSAEDIPTENSRSLEAELIAQIDTGFSTITLANGLTVIVRPDHSTAQVFVGMWYLVGSKDEPAGRAEFAHLFEHLMFFSSPNYDGNYFEQLRTIGATDVGGQTGFDSTRYQQVVPSHAFDLALWLESDRMVNLARGVTQATLDAQRNVIRNELGNPQSEEDSPELKRVLHALFPPSHPYRHPTYGLMDDLDQANLTDVKSWHREHYGASNALLVLVGDVTVETAKSSVSKYFGHARPGTRRYEVDSWVPVLPTSARATVYGERLERSIKRHWVMPPAGSRDAVLLGGLIGLLGKDEGDPFRRILIEERKLAEQVYFVPNFRKLAGWGRLEVVLAPGAEFAEVEAAIDEALMEFLSEGPAPESIRQWARYEVLSALDQMESIGLYGQELANGYIQAGDPSLFKRRLQWISEASPEDFRRVAQKWLTRNFYQEAQSPHPEFKAVAPTFDTAKMPATKPAEMKPRFPKIETTILPNGIELIVAKVPGRPVIKGHIDFRTGEYAQRENEAGLSEVLPGFLFQSGTASHSHTENAARAQALGLLAGGEMGPYHTGITFRVPASRLPQAMRYFSDLFEQADLGGSRFDELIRPSIEMSDQLWSEFGRTLQWRDVIFGQAFAAGIVDPAALRRLSLGDATSFRRREFAPSNMTVNLVGDIDLAGAKQALHGSLGAWQNAGEPTPPPFTDALPNAPRIVLKDRPGATQTRITVGQALPKVSSEELLALEMIAPLLRNRMSANLRGEGKGWVYSISSELDQSIHHTPTISFSGSFQADRTADSMRELKREFERLLGDRPISDAEAQGSLAKFSQLLSSQAATTSGILELIVASTRRDLAPDHHAERLQHTSAFSSKQLSDIARKAIKPDQLTWLIEGDLAEIEAEIRGLGFGEIQVWDGPQIAAP